MGAGLGLLREVTFHRTQPPTFTPIPTLWPYHDLKLGHSEIQAVKMPAEGRTATAGSLGKTGSSMSDTLGHKSVLDKQK